MVFNKTIPFHLGYMSERPAEVMHKFKHNCSSLLDTQNPGHAGIEYCQCFLMFKFKLHY